MGVWAELAPAVWLLFQGGAVRFHPYFPPGQAKRMPAALALLTVSAAAGLVCGCGPPQASGPPRGAQTTVAANPLGPATTAGSNEGGTGGGGPPVTTSSIAPLPEELREKILSCGDVRISQSLPGPAVARHPSPADLQELQQAYEAFSLQPPPNGVIVSSARLAYMASENTSYAIASFPTQPGQLQQTVLFYKIPNCVWFPLQYSPIPFPCPGQIIVPPGVIVAWGLTRPSSVACRSVFQPPTPR